MKLNRDTLKRRRVAQSPRGRKPSLDKAVLFNFFLPGDEKQAMLDLVIRAKPLKILYTLAYILREGAKLFVKEQHRQLDLALNGEFHAKKRKPIKLGVAQQIRKTTKHETELQGRKAFRVQSREKSS